MNKVVVLVDIQNDFVSGSLGSPEAQAIVPKVIEYLKTLDSTDKIFITLDTHGKNYLETFEGKNLPVEHCISGTPGWALPQELESAILNSKPLNCAFEKDTFGSIELALEIENIKYLEEISEIVFMGLCTDICVISNVLITKAYCPDTKISVKADCCAGVTPEKHAAALEAMRSCQINIIGE